jgi:two-component system, OmpR family, response regulator VanR
MTMAAQVNILIVEDSPTQTKLLRLILEQNDYVVDSALNGLKALEHIRSKKPDLIITDIVMPEMDGFALCKTLKSDSNFKHIPVMLLTSLSDPQDVVKGLQAGADNFLTKPYEDTFLVSRIQTIFENQELRKHQRTDSDVEIMFAGQKYFINSDRMQITDLLLSTYENAVQKTNELKKAHNDLIDIYRQLEQKNIELEKLNQNLQHALAEVKTLSGLLPICAHCKKIRDDQGYWNQIETYMAKRINVEFTHGICPSCAKKYFPNETSKS